MVLLLQLIEDVHSGHGKRVEGEYKKTTVFMNCRSGRISKGNLSLFKSKKLVHEIRVHLFVFR